MKTLNWIICAAGRGERFRRIGITQPKPLIELKKKSMLERALESLPIKKGDSLTIVTLKSNGVKRKLLQKLRNKYQGVSVSFQEIPRVTSGQLTTAVQALAHRKLTGPIAVFNCDTFFRAPNLRNAILDPQFAGVLPCAHAAGGSWSFCKTKRGSLLIEKVSEKNRISNWVSVGLYTFYDPQEFFRLARGHLKRSRNSGKREAYIAPLYNDYLKLGHRLRVIPCSRFKPFGTPEQVKKFWNQKWQPPPEGSRR